MRIRLDLGYDGTDFAGWARQPGQRTVCAVLEETLSTVLREPVALTVAGRTDAGVHATGQVAHADVSADVDPGALPHRLARLLPPDVRVFRARTVPAAFDARFAALRRHYGYRVSTAAWGADPLRARDTLAWPRALDIEAMNAAAAPLLGEHDFAAFCRRRESVSTVRELQRLEWTTEFDGVLLARVTADAFCHSMVRGLVGALLAVGEGRRATDWPASLLDATARCSEIPVAPAHGLTLLGVDYPPETELAARTAVTRQRRTGCSEPSATA